MATQENRSMVSETSICNQALAWLGGPQITSLDEDSRFAAWMKINYPFIRDAVLEEGLWSFASVRAKSIVADMDEWETMYVHPKPDDWIAVKRVYENVESNDPAHYLPSEGWVLEQGNVLSSCSVIYLYGIQRITDTGAFTPMFVQALAARLAADACIPLTENRLLQRELWILYQQKLRLALSMDGQQAKNERVRARRLQRIR